MAERDRATKLNKRLESLMSAERWTDGVDLLKEHLSLVRDDWRLSWNPGWCYFKLDRLNDALPHLLRATELAPESAVCKWALGAVYLHKKQYGKAEAALSESLKIKDAHIARICLALAYLERGKVEEAEAVHLEAIKLKPEDARRYDSYADFLSDVGREDEARIMYRKAKRLTRKTA